MAGNESLNLLLFSADEAIYAFTFGAPALALFGLLVRADIIVDADIGVASAGAGREAAVHANATIAHILGAGIAG